MADQTLGQGSPLKKSSAQRRNLFQGGWGLGAMYVD